jgi:hypothetical protein
MENERMSIDLFAGIAVSDLTVSLAWYEKLLDAKPSFFPNDKEAVWEMAESAWLYIELRPAHAGHAMITLFASDFDTMIAGIAKRGIEPARQETYDNGVRKTTFHDPDGNEIGIGGGPGR